jgi:hypothetical protein
VLSSDDLCGSALSSMPVERVGQPGAIEHGF